MRTHRGKNYDWSKPFKLIDSKTLFDELEINENQLIISFTSKPQPASAPIVKKQQIIVPKIQTVPRITQVKEFATVDPNYHRLSANLNLPKLVHYQLNEVDHMFLQGHSYRYIFNNKQILDSQFLSNVFVAMELKAGKDPVLPKNKSWMMAYFQKQFPQLLSYEKIQQFAEVLYNYWKNRRQQLKFPLLRSLWRPNPDEFNHLLAFKPREKEKRNLRRNNRLPEDQIAQQLQEEFTLALKIMERIKMREELKTKQVHLQISSFHNEYRQQFQWPSFIEDFNFDHRIKDKEKLKRLSIDIDKVKKDQIEIEKQNQAMENVNQVYDHKQSIVSFIATVIKHADEQGITYQKIFAQKNINKPLPPIPILEEKQSVVQKPQEQPPSKPNEGLGLGLVRMENTIYRTLDYENYSEPYRKIPTNYFEYKLTLIKNSYFGDDDQGDYKDLKKNVSQSFKKFLQYNKSINQG